MARKRTRCRRHFRRGNGPSAHRSQSPWQSVQTQGVASGPHPRGSAPAASLKQPHLAGGVHQDARIRGVCPRGLIEAGRVRPTGRGHSRIRGVCPRGLIEAKPPAERTAATRCASAGSAPAASLKPMTLEDLIEVLQASAGSAPAASLKPGCPTGRRVAAAASAGSAPAASLKLADLQSVDPPHLGASAGSAPAASLKRG